MTEKEKDLRDLVDKAIALVDAGIFSRQEKHEILREVRGSLIAMSRVLGTEKPDTTPPPSSGNPAA